MIISLLFLLFATLHGTTAQNVCTTPDKTYGLCVNVRDCKSILEIFQSGRPITKELRNYLLTLQCGFDNKDPKVCCEQQTPTTPKTTTVGTSPFASFANYPNVSNHPNLRLINSDICGPTSGKKIFGGNATEIFEYPWMALLAYRTPGQTTQSFKCGGTVINKRYVLTAAHCVSARPDGTRLTGVRLGEHDVNTDPDCSRDENGAVLACAERYQDIGVESVQFHSQYSECNMVNDIALVRLSSDANFVPKNVKPICLPVGSVVPAAKKLTVTGWGVTERNTREMNNALLQAQLTPINTEECAQAYKKKIKIWDRQLCAGGKKGVSSCGGDSGGPLQAQTMYKNTIRYVQYGVVSFGLQNCDIGNVPGVYTKVMYYMDWILDTIRP